MIGFQNSGTDPLTFTRRRSPSPCVLCRGIAEGRPSKQPILRFDPLRVA
jgi:hypothetical protein